MSELLPCKFCKKPPGTKVGPPAMARCITPGCEGTKLAAYTFPKWNDAAAPCSPDTATHMRRPEYITAWLFDRKSTMPIWLIKQYKSCPLPDDRIGYYATAADGEFWRWFDPVKFDQLFTGVAQPPAEPVAWLYETWCGEDYWSQRYSDTKPAGNKWERNIRPLYLAVPSSPAVDWATALLECRDFVADMLGGAKFEGRAFDNAKELIEQADAALSMTSTHHQAPVNVGTYIDDNTEDL